MAVSPLTVLALQCAGMLIGTFICGIIPLYLSLSKTKLRMLEVIGAGLLVGASMTVVLPEGVQALYSAKQGQHFHKNDHVSQIPSTLATGQAHSAWAWSKLSKRTTFRERSFDPESTVGIALLAGFLVMFLIDQIASPGAHVHAAPSGSDREAHNHWHGPSHRPESLRLTRASSLMISKDDPLQQNTNSSSGRHFRINNPSSSMESSPEQMPADHDHVPHSQAHLLDDSHHTGTSSTTTHLRDDQRQTTTNRPRKSSDPQNRSIGNSQSDPSQSRSIRQAFASIAGLIIHAAADGIAMGASAGSDDDSLKLVVLLAIMIHKAPAAFGLCTLLMGQRLHKSQIRRAIAIFSLSTPLGAILTYSFLSLVLKSSPDSNAIGSEHIGGALTFSAGTFMFVAMHAVQELTSAAADIDLDGSTHHHHHHHHNGHTHHYEGVSTSSHGAPAEAPPRQILGRTGRVSCFLLGTILPKIMQGLVGHHH